MSVVLERCAELHEIESKMIAEGKTPIEGNGHGFLLTDDENLEATVMNGMYNKYYKIIEFYTETKEYVTAKKAYVEWGKFAEQHESFGYYWNMDYETMSPMQKEIFDELNAEYKVPITESKYAKRFKNTTRQNA